MLDLNLENEFFNKKIILTGASKGLGAETCKVLASKGARIAMLSRSKIEMDKLRNVMKNSSNHISIKVDLLKNRQIKTAVQKAKKFLKEVDIIIHIAGGGYGLKEALIKNKLSTNMMVKDGYIETIDEYTELINGIFNSLIHSAETILED